MGKHEDKRPDSQSIGNQDPNKRGRGGKNETMGQPDKGGKHAKDQK
jgi:hypothetical protein